MSYFNTDWKTKWAEKKASMTETSDIDIEKTFADMASGFVANKVGDLMQDKYRIGFEVVKKNDDNTRMLGIFAFKVDKELIFAPVFFLSGQIKGPLLYRCDMHQFFPANKEWAQHLISSMEINSGEGISKAHRGNSTPMVDMGRLLMRPKSASADAEPQEVSIKEACAAVFGENIEEGLYKAAAEALPVGILKELLNEPNVGKQTAELIYKAAALEGSENLIRHLADLYGSPENLIPSEFQETVKEASDHSLGLVYGLTKESAAKPEQYFKDGFFMYDNRYKTDTCKVYIDNEKSLLTNVADAGVYDLLTTDGKFINDCICLNVNLDEKDIDCIGGCCCSDVPCGLNSATDPQVKIIIKDGKFNIVRNAKLLGIQKTNQEQIADEDNKNVATLDTVEPDNLYVAVSDNMSSASYPFYVKSKKTTDGVDYCKIHYYTTYSCDRDYIWVDYDANSKAIINKDATTDLTKSIFGKNTKFIKLNTSKYDTKNDSTCSCPSCESVQDSKKTIEHIDNLAQGDADVWVFNSFDLPTLKVNFDKSANYPYTIEDTLDGVQSVGLTRKEILVKLARDLSIHADDAYTIVDNAEAEGSCGFKWDGLNKIASRIHIVSRPMFQDTYTSSTGLPMQEPEKHVLAVSADQNFDDIPRVGDALNPIMATGLVTEGLPTATVISTSPEELKSLADMYKLPNVFEHGMVGTLANTFDAGQLLLKYIPKLQEALDSLGRIKFLFYWKPDDFERMYGSDDMTDLESEIESNFDRMGELVLNLIKRSDRIRKGEVKDGKF